MTILPFYPCALIWVDHFPSIQVYKFFYIYIKRKNIFCLHVLRLPFLLTKLSLQLAYDPPSILKYIYLLILPLYTQ